MKHATSRSHAPLLLLFLLLFPLGAWAGQLAAGGGLDPENLKPNIATGSGVVIGAGETWRCLRAPPDSARLPANWNAPEFDDSGWTTAITGTSYAPEEDAASSLTTLDPRPGWIFLRKSFAVEPAATIRWLILRVEHDGPFRAWLNGMEVTGPAQAKTDRGPNAYESYLLPRFTMTEVDLTPHLGLLKPGTNTLAVVASWHPSRDLAVVATPVLLANFTRGPFLQSPTPESVSIVWRTPLPTTTRVEFGSTPALGQTWREEVATTHHLVTLTALAPDSLYYYRIGGADAGGLVASGLEQFRTFKRQGSLTFVVVGDTGLGTPAQGAIARVIRDARPDFVMHDGDIIYRGFSDVRADDRVFHYYQRQMRSVPWFFAVGNHDFNCCVGQPDFSLDNWQLHATHYQKVFHLPTNAVTGTCHFYSFDHGDAHFSVLHHPWFSHYVFNAHKEQYHWLTNDLAQSDKPWKFLVLHSPIAHSGAHGLDDRNLDGVPDQHEMMSLLLPLTQRYGVQAVFAGHDHNYERFVPTNGLHHVVTGGGGGALYALVARHPGSAQFWKTYHCLKVHVEGETLLCEALGVQGEVFDSFSITKSVPTRRVWSSTWHTPKIASGPANDGDGNVQEQVFDFAGEPIPALAGQFSNLGRFFVNNDATHLYLGFKQATFYGNNNVFLFLESPRLPGVRALAGLGNGQVDPRGEGADGLDFLKNLSFTNFTPAIACLLGDEMADGQFRSFARPGLPLNIGQGVFRLDKAFSDVPGIRLQQFNRSPQTYSGPLRATGADAEQNADFMEVAIPFSALGGVRPGELVKVGAVVGGAEVNLQTYSRQLDSGFLGAAMIGHGMGPIELEGVSVKLAAPTRLATSAETKLDWIRLSPDGRGFVRAQSTNRFVAWGFNYDHDRPGRLLEDYWQGEWQKVEEDFAEIKTLGANTVRIHLQVARFMETPTRPSEAALRQLGRLVGLAERTGLYLDVTGLACYHKTDVPAWYDALDETARWNVQARFWEAVATICADSPAVFCYDLMNEPILPGKKPETEWLTGELGGEFFVQRLTLDLAGRPRELVARAWVDKLAAAIRRVDPRHLITVGEIPWVFMVPKAKPFFASPEVGGALDFYSVHFYPKKGQVDKALTAVAAYQTGKPLLIEEMFPLECGVDDLNTFIEGSRKLANGWLGFYWGKTENAPASKKNDLADALIVGWLNYFRGKAPEMIGPP